MTDKTGKVPKSVTKRPQPKGGSRKGKPNKVTKELKEMILGALDKAGGENYLFNQALNNPNAFLALIGKVLPTTLAGDPKNPIQARLTVEFIGTATKRV